LDGYPKGWVAVWLSGQVQKIEYLSHIGELLNRNFDIAMIDMPIGLPVSGYRDCDHQARSLLGSNRTRVFLGARRCFLNCKTHADAMTPELQSVVMECHPELVFWRLNNCNPVPRKKDPEGVQLRVHLLEKQGLRHLDEFINSRLGQGAHVDDVLDACACAVAARDRTSERKALGGNPDKKGLRMEIHY
jgi:predicted RNase H-like nuclease